MAKSKPKLLARSGTIEGIQSLINRFWYSTSYRVNPQTLAIENDNREPPPGYRVTEKRGAYRFEQLNTETANEM